MKAIFKQMNDDISLSETKSWYKAIILGIIFLIGLLITQYVIDITKLNAYLGWGIALVLFIIIVNYITKGDDKVKEKSVIGEVVFETETISFKKQGENQCLPSQNITAINLNYNHILGKSFVRRDISHNGLALLTVQTNPNETLEMKFVIETQAQLDELKPIWKEYYKQKIKIKESDVGMKMILFEQEQNLSYETIQELKEELGISSFY